MEEYHIDHLDLDTADFWCRGLYYENLKTLDLKGKRVLEIGCNEARVTRRLVRDKDFYQYEHLTSVDMQESVIEKCKTIIPGHDFRCVDLTRDNITDFLDYDIYLIFYTYIVLNEKISMFKTIRRLVNEFNKEVVVYESLIDDFARSGCTYNSKSYEMLVRLTLDKVLRTSNNVCYLNFFNIKQDHGFTYLYKK